jgi:hypothetical protein
MWGDKDFIKKYNEMRAELYQWVRKFLKEKTGKEIPPMHIDHWSVSTDSLYVEYYDEDEDEDRTLLVDIDEFLNVVNKSK